MAKEIIRRLDDIEYLLDERKLTRLAYDFFKNKTPIRSGNARRRTTYRDNNIRADYPYAGRLDQGYSRQAPEGMSQPTVEYIQDYIQKTLRR